MLGTPAYMAPEQHALEPATEASDQFAFCVSCGRLFGSIRSSSEIAARCRRSPIALPDLRRSLVPPAPGTRVPARRSTP